MADGNVMILQKPVVKGDTLTGELRVGLTNPRARVAIPVAEIRELQTSQLSPLATTGLVAGIVAVAFVSYALYILANLDDY